MDKRCGKGRGKEIEITDGARGLEDRGKTEGERSYKQLHERAASEEP